VAEASLEGFKLHEARFNRSKGNAVRAQRIERRARLAAMCEARKLAAAETREEKKGRQCLRDTLCELALAAKTCMVEWVRAHVVSRREQSEASAKATQLAGVQTRTERLVASEARRQTQIQRSAELATSSPLPAAGSAQEVAAAMHRPGQGVKLAADIERYCDNPDCAERATTVTAQGTSLCGECINRSRDKGSSQQVYQSPTRSGCYWVLPFLSKHNQDAGLQLFEVKGAAAKRMFVFTEAIKQDVGKKILLAKAETKEAQKAILKLSREVKLLEEQRSSVPTCCVCMESEPVMALLPCGHVCLCGPCASEWHQKVRSGLTSSGCLLCRKTVTQIARTFRN